MEKNVKTIKRQTPKLESRVTNHESRSKPHWIIWVLIKLGIFALGIAVGILWQAHRQSPAAIAVANKIELSPCQQIEKILLGEMPDQNNNEIWAHTYRANVFAILTKRGCPANQQSFREAALGEVQVAQALVEAEGQGTDNNVNIDNINKVYFQLDAKDMARAFSDEINRAAAAVSGFVDTMKNIRVSVGVEQQ